MQAEKNIAIRTWPVSYTHLDVYKRQVLYKARVGNAAHYI